MFMKCIVCMTEFKRIKRQKYCSEKCKWDFYKKSGKTKIYRLNNREYRLEYMKKWHNDHRVIKSSKPRIAWNKGLTKNDPRVAKYAVSISNVKKGKTYPYMFRKGKWTGEKNPRWKGGITFENSKIRFSKEYIEWRNAVRKKDNSTCQNCGFNSHQAGKMIAHHIKGFANYPELRFDVSNGIILCRPCHSLVDHNISNNFFKKGFDPKRNDIKNKSSVF